MLQVVLFLWIKLNVFLLFKIMVLNSDAIEQRPPNLILEGRCPAEFSSNLPQHTSHFFYKVMRGKMIVECYYLRACYTGWNIVHLGRKCNPIHCVFFFNKAKREMLVGVGALEAV